MFNDKIFKSTTSKLFGEMRARSGLTDMLKNSGWLFLDKAMRAVLGLLVGAWVARYLGPSQFGELSYYIALIAIFQSITTLGMDGIVVREIAKTSSRENIILGTVFWMRLLAGCICWVSILIYFAISDPENKQGIWIFGIVGASLIFQSSDVVDLWFQGKSQNKRGVYAKLSAFLIANVIKVVLIVLSAKLISFAIVVALEAAVVALSMCISYSFYPSRKKWLKSWKLAKQLIKESWPYLISGVSIMIYMRIDQVMIKEMLGENELGLFSAALPFATIWNVVPVVICAVLLPYMSKKRLESSKEFNRYLVYIFRFFWASSIALIIFTNLASHFLIANFYGDSYKEAIPVLDIYILTITPIFLGVAQNLWILNERKSYLVLLQTTVGATLSIIMNLLLIPILGLQGAAIAAVISQCISAVLINSIFSRELFRMQLGFNSKN
ncbi:flippase [Polynucleobacter sphagniphilus]|jgi:PST family polysaccharide transporter|uniref:O-antigen/teichoic acid export membrane protein n=1 Tax=Polynucleobacter sphagniphilus TaxID=1743169 RepID=A0AA43S7D5_9BURK|nr:flippase [Polynucleobacter sphagniphilus]MDH6504731.1 O-antigen/teichoic acid export membrane protein [Polynucleobacter sphagniphilus]MDH6513465.1 O-antigen/teichoic acid export membrane protein [Polynucleobacter sphagniphilus]